MKPIIDKRYEHKNRSVFFTFQVDDDSIDESGVMEWVEEHLDEMESGKIDTITIHAKRKCDGKNTGTKS